MTAELALIGSAIAWGSHNKASEDGPKRLQQRQIEAQLAKRGVAAHWRDIIQAPPFDPAQAEASLRIIIQHTEKLRHSLASAVKDHLAGQGGFPVTLGGDHSGAIGHYAGILQALPPQEKLGVIWIDAHADLNTPESTLSGHIHGMPLAVMMGHGAPELTRLLQQRFIGSDNICLLAVRDLDPYEADMIAAQSICRISMEEIGRNGLAAALEQARAHVLRHADHFAVTLDLDALDPQDAPDVATPVAGGLHAAELLRDLPPLLADPACCAMEIVEYAPQQADAIEENHTERLILDLLTHIAQSRHMAAQQLRL